MVTCTVAIASLLTVLLLPAITPLPVRLATGRSEDKGRSLPLVISQYSSVRNSKNDQQSLSAALPAERKTSYHVSGQKEALTDPHSPIESLKTDQQTLNKDDAANVMSMNVPGQGQQADIAGEETEETNANKPVVPKENSSLMDAPVTGGAFKPLEDNDGHSPMSGDQQEQGPHEKPKEEDIKPTEVPSEISSKGQLEDDPEKPTQNADEIPIDIASPLAEPVEEPKLSQEATKLEASDIVNPEQSEDIPRDNTAVSEKIVDVEENKDSAQEEDRKDEQVNDESKVLLTDNAEKEKNSDAPQSEAVSKDDEPALADKEHTKSELSMENLHEPLNKKAKKEDPTTNHMLPALDVPIGDLFEEDRSFKGGLEGFSLAAISHGGATGMESKSDTVSDLDDIIDLHDRDNMNNEATRSERENKKKDDKKDKEKFTEKEKLLSKPSSKDKEKESKPFKQHKPIASDDPVQEYEESSRKRRSLGVVAASLSDTRFAPVEIVRIEEPTSQDAVSIIHDQIPGSHPVFLPNEALHDTPSEPANQNSSQSKR